MASVQSEGSLWTRDAFAEVVPWCAAHGAAFLPFAPLGRGFLTGALAPQKFPSGDFRKNNPRFQPEAMDANAALVETVKAVAARLDATPAQVALAWLLAQGEHIAPIPGTKRRSRLEENAAAASLLAQRRGPRRARRAARAGRLALLVELRVQRGEDRLAVRVAALVVADAAELVRRRARRGGRRSAPR